MNDNTTKTCSRCYTVKSINQYYKVKASKDGRYSYCIDCSKKRSREYYENNSQKLIDYTKKWKQENPDKHKAQVRRWQIKNPEMHKQYLNNWRARNPEKVSDQNHRRRSRKNFNGVFTISKKFLKNLYASTCLNCGSNQNITADHVIPISRGGRHSEGNLIPLCQSCNSKKGSKTITEWKTSD